MGSKNGWWATLAFVALGVFLSISATQAEEAYDIMVCGSATWTPLTQSRELSIISVDYKGIARSNDENKFLDNCTVHHVRVSSIVNGKTTSRFQHGASLLFSQMVAPFTVRASLLSRPTSPSSRITAGNPPA